ncbi:MAG: cation-translocating P-type ATPase, partial [Burkholderiales bacterium]|nr:cation-translocating P-type ATPase [Burkholderiales bacterium]
HIAFLELVIDPTGTLVFEAEAGGAGLMQRPPRRAQEPLLSRRHMLLSVLQGSCITAGVMALYALALAQGWAPAAAATAAFVCLVVANGVLILPSRADHWRQPLLRGLPGVSMVVLGGTLAALLLVTLWAPLAQAFGFAVLGPLPWLLSGACGVVLLPVFLMNKRFLARVNAA